MPSSELKNLANIAKQRMRSANYKSPSVKYSYNKTNNYFLKNISAMRKLSGNCEFVTLTDSEDLAFLKKVFSMLNNNEEVYNPIGRLLDKEYFSSLSGLEKQVYVFTLADKYNHAKEKYLSQNSKVA